MKVIDIRKQVSTSAYSPNTEIHWVPRVRAGRRGGKEVHEEWAAASPRLGARDWSTIDPVCVRTSKGLTKGTATPALYYWRRAERHVWCESQLEKDELMWLDYSGQVRQVWSQPFVVIFDRDVPLNHHIPDLLVELNDERLALFDVKPAERIGPKERIQFEATAAVCESLGWPYKVLDGHPREQTRVLKWLWGSSLDRFAPPVDVEDRILTHARHGATRADLCAIADPDCPPRAASWVDHLAWRRRLHVDLSQRFDSNTVFTTTDKDA